jgi:hypothetical protein
MEVDLSKVKPHQNRSLNQQPLNDRLRRSLPLMGQPPFLVIYLHRSLDDNCF